MGVRLKQMTIFLANHRPRDEMGYIRHLLPAINVTMGDLEGANINFQYVTSDKLNTAYISGFAMASGIDLNRCTVTPFNDADGGRGQVLKVEA